VAACSARLQGRGRATLFVGYAESRWRSSQGQTKSNEKAQFACSKWAFGLDFSLAPATQLVVQHFYTL